MVIYSYCFYQSLLFYRKFLNVRENNHKKYSLNAFNAFYIRSSLIVFDYLKTDLNNKCYIDIIDYIYIIRLLLELRKISLNV